MYHSLNRLAALPSNTLVYCTHEYTLSNAKFAIHVEPEIVAIQNRLADVQHLRDQEQPTLPTSIQLELETNPFLRANSLAEFQRLREMKDQF
jgi:hydroxyacylglutathione hydrolase